MLRLEPLEELRLLAVDMVTSNLDDGSNGTLRSVIAAAAPGDTIEFNSGISQINLTQGQIEINKDITVHGPGANLLTIDQTTSGGTRVCQIDGTDASNNPITVSMSGLTLTGGHFTGAINASQVGGGIYNLGTLLLDKTKVSGNDSPNGGGGINNSGTLTVTNSTFSNNFGEFGGGIYNNGTLTVTDSNFSNNNGAFGGGIGNVGTLSVSGSTFSGNHIGGYGGGLCNGAPFGTPFQATATVTDCTISGNVCSIGNGTTGGGIFNNGTITIVSSTISQNSTSNSLGGGGIANRGDLTLDSSTVSQNTTDAGGAGICNNESQSANQTFALIENSTISDNSTVSGAFGGNGGGIFNNTFNNNPMTLWVINSTISGNAAKSGGGIATDSIGDTLLIDTIVAGNTATQANPDVTGNFDYSFSDSNFQPHTQPPDHDLIGVLGNATGFTASGSNASLLGTANNPLIPQLGMPGDNGGPTQTMALLPGSPAINAGDNAPPLALLDITMPTADQRGLPRIVNGKIDIGAYEVQSAPLNYSAAISENYTLKVVNGLIDLFDANGNVVAQSTDTTDAASFINNSTGTVTLSIDYSGGNPVPADDLAFTGGGSDGLVVTGYANTDVVAGYGASNSGGNSGTVQVTPSGSSDRETTGFAINYSGLSSLNLSGNANNLVVALPNGTVRTTLQDDGMIGNDTSELTSGSNAFANTTFTVPTNSLTVYGGQGADTFNVARSFTSDFNANVSLIGGAGDDTFNIYATPASRSLTVNGAGSVNGDVLNDFASGDAEVWSDAGTPPVVSIATSGQTPLTFTSIQQVNVTAGNGVVNVYGDDNQPATSQNDGYQVVGTGPNALTLAVSGNNANQASYSLPINFSGVRTLNVDGEAKGTTGAHNDTNTLAITPYADNTPQGWGVQTFWNQGDANAAGTLIYNATTAVSENIALAPSGPGSGQIDTINSATNSPVAVINFTQNTNVVVNGSDNSTGASDSLTLKGTNPGASGNQHFTADFATPGSNGSNLRISNMANGETLYMLASATNIGTLDVTGAGAPAQNTLLIDGYNPATAQSGLLDSSLTVGEDRTSSTSGVVSVFQSQPPGEQYPEINYSGIGTLNVNAASGAPVQGPTISFGSAGVAGSGLDGASDSGVAGQPATLADRITADSTPTFYGTAQANAVIQLYVDMNGNGQVDSGDVLIGQATASPSAGQNSGQWAITSTVDLNNPRFGFAHDGVRTILAVATDGAGDVSSPQSLTIFVDTQGPQVGKVSVSGSPNYNLFLTADQPTPTPLVNSLDVTFTDPVARGGGFVFPAVSPALATTVGDYQLVGRTNGVIPITSVTFTDNTVAGGQGTSVATLHFATPLPDDFYTLTVSDAILDNAGNALDGEFNGSSFPSGNSSPGGNFTGSFVVNSHPHLALAAGGSVSLDINGNGTFDPSNTVPDSDFVETFGLPNDRLFSGKFASPSGTVSGFDELGAYGSVNGQWRWLVNSDPAQGTSSPTSYVEPLSVDGTPVAGYFAGNRSLGMQVGLFNNGTWYFDVLNHHTIDQADVNAGGKLTGSKGTTMKGLPIVGDFDGDGKTDLATYHNGVFEFDLSSKDPGGKLTGNYNATINAQTLIAALGAPGASTVPVVADLDGDGITDLGLYVTGLSASSTTGQWFWLVSNDGKDASGVNPTGAFASLNHAFNPAPLGHDLSYQYGDPSGTPLIGVWDPPTSAAGTSTAPPTSGFVPSLYATVLGRQPSSAEVSNWNDALASGQTTDPQVAQTFLDSSERLGSIINGYYEQYLGRTADQVGLSYWIGVWQANGGPEQVQAGIIGSPEYYATAGKLYPNLSADAAWVTALYNNLLGRSPDQQGLDYWVSYIQTNSKQSVVLGFVTSDEYRLGLIDGWFEQYLGRPVDAAGAQYWLGQMQEGVTQDQVQSALLASTEFANRSQASP